AATRLDRPAPRFDAAVLAAFTAYRWPGNVRELRNVVDAMVALSLSDDRLTEADLPPELLKAPDRVGPILSLPPKTGTVQGIALKAAERSAILAQVDACGGNLTLAARRLGIARSTLYVRLAEYGYPRMPGGA
ncbi:sigma-54-dependent Fis family transcriptional regulator, partial [Methylobacterium sp. WL18]